MDNNNLTPEELEKRKKINIKILKFIGIMVVFIFFLVLIIALGTSFTASSSIDSEETKEEFVIISGTASSGGLVKINNNEVVVEAEKYSEKIPLSMGDNNIVVTYTSDKKTEEKIFNIFRTNARLEKIKEQFSPWDGSHNTLTKLIKRSMNDRSSYEHVKTTYWDQKDHIVVLTKFRGKNSFGAKVMNYVKASFDLDGNLIKVLDQGQ